MSDRVNFYVRLSEVTFSTDPAAVAAAFLDSPQSRRLREAPTHARGFLLRHLDGPLSRYLQSKGVGWERDPRQPDPHRTRHAYEVVYRLVRAHLTEQEATT